ncbi:hypothetical protein MXB_1216 [Myxobolus squamalis]|nr:hypothetical protein MXB_1216 [Myxobolus squamalis]
MAIKKYTGDGENIPSSSITISNISSNDLLFKVKTTTPEFFSVDPPIGIIKPSATGTVVVRFTGHKEDIGTKPIKFLVLIFDGAAFNSDLKKPLPEYEPETHFVEDSEKAQEIESLHLERNPDQSIPYTLILVFIVIYHE